MEEGKLSKKDMVKKALKEHKKILGIFIVIFIIMIGFMIFSSRKHSFNNYPLVYADTDGLVLWRNGNKFVIDKDYSTEKNSSLSVAYSNKGSNILAYVNSKNLYVFNTKNNKNAKLVSNVDEVLGFSGNDQYLIYSDDSGNYLSYDLKNNSKDKLISKKDDISYSISKIIDNKVIYTSKEDSKESLYVYDLKKKDNNKISDNISYHSKVFDSNIIYYLIENDDTGAFYSYNIKKNASSKLIDKINNIYSSDENLEKIIYTVKSKDKLSLLDDDEAGKDPVTEVEEKVTCTYSLYSSGKCTRNQWYNDEEVIVKKVTDKKEVNDKIRESNNKLESYDVYYYNDGKIEKIASNVVSILGADYNTKALVVRKNLTEEKIKISTLKSVNDFTDYVQKNINYYYIKGNEQYIEITLPEDNFIISNAVILKDLSAYVISNKDLYYLNIKDNNKDLKLIDSKISDYTIYNNEELLYLIENDDNKDLKKVKGNKSEYIVSDASRFNYNEDLSSLYIYSDCGEEDSCIYSVYNGKLKKILNDVTGVYRINDSEYYVFKNYSKKNGTFDIYSFKKGKLEKIAFDVNTRFISFKNES